MDFLDEFRHLKIGLEEIKAATDNFGDNNVIGRGGFGKVYKGEISHWNAKISDLGLSKVGPANQQHTVLVTNVVGTPGYIDPLYMETYRLTKESDVYSFGVVLFEVLCGRLCFRFSEEQWENFVPLWKQSYEQKKLSEIIFQDLMQQMNLSSLETFSNIACQCLQRSREERPTMDLVVKKLETALKHQMKYEK